MERKAIMINLNEEQQKVVNEQKNNIILLASAGTGKTNTLAERVTSIIKNGNSKPSEILCITFTNKACKEMSDRVMKIVGGEAKDITIRTFHSFCFDVVRTYAKRNTDIFSDFTILIKLLPARKVTLNADSNKSRLVSLIMLPE